MKCYTVDGTGLAGLSLQERPDVGEPGRDEVLLDVRAVSLNYRDLMVADGRYGRPASRPIIACSDAAGVVTAVGDGVSALKPGDRVINAPFRCWPAGPLRSDWARTFVGGGGVDGVLAQRVIYPAQSLVNIPDSLSFVQASTLPVAGLTAWAAVVTFGKTQPGHSVLLHGTGGVSVFGAQIAKALGARTFMSTSSEAKAQLAKQRLHVDHTFDYRDPHWPKQIRQMTDGRGVDVVVEVAGGRCLDKSIQVCGYAGRVGVIGVLDGPVSEINVPSLLVHQVTVRGILTESTHELRAFVRAVGAIGLEPQVDRVFSFDQVPEAFEHMRSGRHFGKVVIQVAKGDDR